MASHWLKFAKEGDTQLYYDAESYQCYKHADRSSGRTTGYSTTVWVKTSVDDDMVMWSLDCSHRKIDKEGHDLPDIYGKAIKPDSVEEILYKRICPTCKSMKY